MVNLTVPCHECGKEFTRKRASGRYCPDCRVKRRGEARDADNEQRRQVRSDARDLMGSYVMGGMEAEYAESLYPRIDDYLDALGEFEGDSWALVPDKQPAGSMTEYGSEDGRTSEYEDVAALLDERGELTAAHIWFLDHPHWSADL